MKMVNRRDFVALASGVSMTAFLAACGGSGTDSADSGEGAGTSEASFKIQMVTDTGGVNDQSFNQLAWEGLQTLEQEKGWEVGYLESRQDSDYATNLDKAVDDNANLIWGIGFAMADAVERAAQQNPDINYAIIDNANGNEAVTNLVGVEFRAQEPSFMVGYIAARTSTTGKVGFVGGIASDVISQFEFGYKAGVAYANKEAGTNVEVSAQYAESFTDAARGKAIATSMFSDGCDIVFHAAGGVGTGVIEAATDANKFAIGVDRDQSDLAPENVLTSALKRVDKAVIEVSESIQAGSVDELNVSLGAAEGCVGIPEDHSHMEEEVYEAALKIEEDIKNGTIVPPANEEDYNSYVATL